MRLKMRGAGQAEACPTATEMATMNEPKVLGKMVETCPASTTMVRQRPQKPHHPALLQTGNSGPETVDMRRPETVDQAEGMQIAEMEQKAPIVEMTRIRLISMLMRLV